MKTITLTQGKVATVDDEDYEWLNQYKWHAAKHGNTFYAVRQGGKWPHQTTILMHREIMKPLLTFEIHHLSGNGLSNQKRNLQVVRHKENASARRKPKMLTSSRYKGVYWDKRRKKWHAHIKHNDREIFLGYFDNENAAAWAYNKAAIKFFRKFAVLNL